MSDSFKIIIIVGGILILSAYIMLYTPVAEVFVPKTKIPQPIRSVTPITKPTNAAPSAKNSTPASVKTSAPTKEVAAAKEVKKGQAPVLKKNATPAPLADKLVSEQPLLPAPKPGAAKPPKPLVASPEAKAKAPADLDISKYVYIRDPFEVGFSFAKIIEEPSVPGAPASASAPKKYLVLQGVFISGKIKSAIIDDKVVYIGSGVAEGYKVAEIKPDLVLLKKGARIKKLKIKL
jgi:hypothetical protein